jgi:uncharacterized protein YegP (UPF0339 family)
VYKSKASCLNGVKSVAKNAPVANVEDQTAEGWVKAQCPKFEMYVDKAGEFRFRLKATNGQVIATSEGYVSKKQELIDKIRSRMMMQAMPMGGTGANGPMIDTNQPLPVLGGKGNGALQRALNETGVV